jgi:type II secretory pathway component HofQ
MALPAMGPKTRAQVIALLDALSSAQVEWLALGTLLDALSDADGVTYDNTTSELAATETQSAIDELNALIVALDGRVTTLEGG